MSDDRVWAAGLVRDEFGIEATVEDGAAVFWCDGPPLPEVTRYLSGRGFSFPGEELPLARTVGTGPAGQGVELVRRLWFVTAATAVVRAARDGLTYGPTINLRDPRTAAGAFAQQLFTVRALPVPAEPEIAVTLLYDLIGRDTGAFILVHELLEAVRDHPLFLEMDDALS